MNRLAEAIVKLESSPLQKDYVPPAIQQMARDALTQESELYEALKEIANSPRSVSMPDAMHRRARIAIAKAEGRTL